MGQQCIESSSADLYELAKKGAGIKITGNGENISTLSKPINHFKKNSSQIELSLQVQKIKSMLGNFYSSQSFNPPKGTAEPQSYKLNDEGLIYCENGEWKDGLPHGRGEMVFPDESYYEGYLENGVPNGQGRFISSQGWFYEGELKNEQADGKGKFINEKLGIQYEGQWAADLPNGSGIEKWNINSSIITYQGQFVNGSKYGFGKYTCPDYIYQGMFKNNKINGKGKIVYKNGQSFEGNFINGKKHGSGTYKWPGGSLFEGGYQNDTKHGNGKFTDTNGKTFEGKWVNGKRQDQGVIGINNKYHHYEWKNNKISLEKKQNIDTLLVKK